MSVNIPSWAVILWISFPKVNIYEKAQWLKIEAKHSNSLNYLSFIGNIGAITPNNTTV